MKLITSSGYNAFYQAPEDLMQIFKETKDRSDERAERIMELYNKVATKTFEADESFRKYLSESSNQHVYLGNAYIQKISDTVTKIIDCRLSETPNDGKITQFTIEEIDTSRMWCIDNYDGIESVIYVKSVDSETNEVKFE